MNFPIFPGKHAAPALFSAADFLKYLQKAQPADLSAGTVPPPQGVILYYSNTVNSYVHTRYTLQKQKHLPAFLQLIGEHACRIGVVAIPGFGAPVAGAFLEQLIAAGITRFITIGSAGSLQKNLNPGDIVVCDKALRDEGTSYHYLPAARFAYASQNMVDAIEKELNQKNRPCLTGASWTTDAVFRETIAEVKKFQEEGILTVDMEASALFSIAAYRQVELGAVFAVSDKLANLQWEPQFSNAKIISSLNFILETAISVLLNNGF